jgi:phenylalanyl-tRNA synthetase beta chain
MKVSLNTIKQYTSVDLSVEELVEKINRQLGGVEEVTDLGKRYEGAVIVRVVQCADHPNADRLHVCRVDDGGVVQNVERGEDGLVQVVCGAPNVHEDMFAVWLPPASAVPSSFDDKEPFVLEARELRGVVSNGMLASAKELAIGDSHEGILEIDPAEWKPTDAEIKPGASFAKIYGLDDTIIDIENKMFTHRPDLFGQLGVAREIAGIQHHAFTSPDCIRHCPNLTGVKVSS